MYTEVSFKNFMIQTHSLKQLSPLSCALVSTCLIAQFLDSSLAGPGHFPRSLEPERPRQDKIWILEVKFKGSG